VCARTHSLARFGEAAPRLIVVGDADPFAPIERARVIAGEIGARLVTLSGRDIGWWAAVQSISWLRSRAFSDAYARP